MYFSQKVGIVLDDFKVTGSSFQAVGAATEKACLPEPSLLLGTMMHLLLTK